MTTAIPAPAAIVVEVRRAISLGRWGMDSRDDNNLEMMLVSPPFGGLFPSVEFLAVDAVPFS
jgi:hypothetical protein